MKLWGQHQHQHQHQHQNRRSGSFRGDSSMEGTASSSPPPPPLSTIFCLFFHAFCCLISLVLGFRFSRILFFLLFSIPSSPTTNTSLSTTLYTTPFPKQTTTSKVVVGRHGIRIRPWPHPDPVEVMRAHQIMGLVQNEQRAQFGIKDPKVVIVVTPTYVRTFQAMHLTGLIHSLMLVPYDVVWIVVEAGGPTNETASIIAKSGLRVIHLGFHHPMPDSWDARHRLEAKMRLHALRVVREQKLEGIVMFGDDSNMHSMELFDEIQNVKWFGAVSVGMILTHSGGIGGENKMKLDAMPVQGPACNSSNRLIGWHMFNTLPYEGKSTVLPIDDDRATLLPRKLQWAGFVFNSRLLWGEGPPDRPDWVKDLDSVEEEEDVESPLLLLLKDASLVEPLGSCGKQVLLWWFRVEARPDSRFPPGWIIDPPLEITVPSKRTPWPDVPPELPAFEKEVINVLDQTMKRSL